jgi:hypothetical protein
MFHETLAQISELFVRFWIYVGTRRALALMDQSFVSLRVAALEMGPMDGLHGLPDKFTALATSTLRNAVQAFLRLGPEPDVLERQEERLQQFKREAEEHLAIQLAGLTPSVRANAWVGPLTITLLGALGGGLLVLAGVSVTWVHTVLLGCAVCIAILQYRRFPAWVAERREARLARRLEWMITANRLRMLREQQRREWVDRWIADRHCELSDLYQLHRVRGERAARLAGSPSVLGLAAEA